MTLPPPGITNYNNYIKSIEIAFLKQANKTRSEPYRVSMHYSRTFQQVAIVLLGVLESYIRDGGSRALK